MAWREAWTKGAPAENGDTFFVRLKAVEEEVGARNIRDANGAAVP